MTERVTIRRAHADDTARVAQLAALDSTPGHVGERLLLAEVEGELRAALSLEDGRVMADPFHPTSELVSLLELRASQVTDGRERRLAARPRLARFAATRLAAAGHGGHAAVS